MELQHSDDPPWRVVLIDDEADIREVTALAIQDAGFRVDTASDGTSGLALCEKVKPRIVITDIRMPGGLDGIAVLERLKKSRPQIEVIVITAFGDVDIAVRALQLDASDFITKPIDAAALQTALDRAKNRFLSRKKVADYLDLLGRENARTNRELLGNIAYRRSLIDSSMDGILGLDPDGKVKEFNKSMADISGHDRSQAVGLLSFGDFFEPAVAADLMRALESPRHGGKDRLMVYETKLLAKSGRHVPVQVSAGGIRGEGGRLGVVWFFKDLRTIRRLEREMTDQARVLHQDKMMSLGRLAASVVHEINNPLSGILNYLKLMLRHLDKGDVGGEKADQFREYLSIVERETARCSNIISNLLRFSRRDAETFEPVSISDLVERAALLIRHKCALSNVALELDTAQDLPMVNGSANQLQQCLLNLLINAVDAMPNGGQIRVVSTCVPGPKVCIRVADTGKGIAKKDLPYIFEPFYTASKEGQGVGLGLSTVYGIVLRHNGTVTAKNGENGGAVFTLELPV